MDGRAVLRCRGLVQMSGASAVIPCPGLAVNLTWHPLASQISQLPWGPWSPMGHRGFTAGWTCHVALSCSGPSSEGATLVTRTSARSVSLCMVWAVIYTARLSFLRGTCSHSNSSESP